MASNIPSPAAVTLMATSLGDTTKSASANITVTQGVLTVVVSPKRAAVTQALSPSQFAANVYNDPQSLGVSWEVDGNNGGTSASGTISATGLYTPGTQPGAHTVTAVSNANASISSSALIAVTDLTGVYTHHNDNARTGQKLAEAQSAATQARQGEAERELQRKLALGRTGNVADRSHQRQEDGADRAAIELLARRSDSCSDPEVRSRIFALQVIRQNAHFGLRLGLGRPGRCGGG